MDTPSVMSSQHIVAEPQVSEEEEIIPPTPPRDAAAVSTSAGDARAQDCDMGEAPLNSASSDPATQRNNTFSSSLRDPSFLEVPFLRTRERIEQGRLVINSFAEVMEGRVAAEDRYIEFLSRAHRERMHEHEITASTMERSMGYMKNYHLFCCKNETLFRKALDEHVVLPLSVLSSKRNYEMGVQTKILEEAERAYAQACESLERAKSKHRKLLEQISDTQAKLIKSETDIAERGAQEDSGKDNLKNYWKAFSPFDSTAEQTIEKYNKRLERLRHECLASDAEIMQKRNNVLTAMSIFERAEENATVIYESLELDRLTTMSSSMRKFCKIERDLLETRLKYLSLLEQGAVSFLSPQEDLALYVAQEKNSTEAQRRSYAIQLLHLSHMNRFNHDDTFVHFPETSNDPADEGQQAIDSPSAERTGAEAAVVGLEGSKDLTSVLPKQAAISSVDSFEDPEDIPKRMATTKRETGVIVDARIALAKHHFELIFGPESEESNVELLNIHVEEWRGVFALNEGRKYFLQVLDEKRSRSAMLSASGFKALAAAMRAFLDECEYVKDRASAMRVANMANTFYCVREVIPRFELGESVGNSNESQDNREQLMAVPTKIYIQREKEIREHRIWRSHRFWEDALQQNVLQQLRLIDSGCWDNMSTAELHESTSGVHNIIFGQLGAMAFTMHELGLPRLQVERVINELCKTSQLSYDQNLELMKSIWITFNESAECNDAIQTVDAPLLRTLGGCTDEEMGEGLGEAHESHEA